MNKPNIFIRILELGEERGVSGINEHEFKEWALAQSDIQSENTSEFVNARVLLKESFYEVDKGHGNPNVFVLKNEYYFRLIEFEELRLSRDASKSAKKYSIVALCLSVLAILSGVYASYQQMNNPVQLDPLQIEKLVDSIETLDKSNAEYLQKLEGHTKENNNISSDIQHQLQSLNKSLQPTANAAPE